jgi:hypothetical protein
MGRQRAQQVAKTVAASEKHNLGRPRFDGAEMAFDVANAFARALLSEASSLPEHAQIFAPFIGGWDLVVSWYDENGTVTKTENGEWFFSWVLEGRGIQDVWIVPPRGQRSTGSPYEYGTSIRFYDPELEAWRSTWIGPMHRTIRTFTARMVGADVVLQTTPDRDPAMRWSFSDIEANTFVWQNEIQEAGGWRRQQSFEARRRIS